jgi:hypothetical protein
VIVRIWRQARHKKKVNPTVYLCRPAHYVKDVGRDQKAWVVEPQLFTAPESEEVPEARVVLNALFNDREPGADIPGSTAGTALERFEGHFFLNAYG